MEILNAASSRIFLEVRSEFESDSGILSIELSPYYNRSDKIDKYDEVEEELLAIGTEIGKIILFNTQNLKNLEMDILDSQ